METKTSSSLIADANIFLDGVRIPKDLAAAEENIKHLSELRDDMLHAGFGAAFQSMLNVSTDESDIEDKAEVVRQLRLFREFANMKRYALNRVRVALAAHGVLYNMLKRGEKYPVADHLPYNGAYLIEIIGRGEPAVRAYSAIQALASKPTGVETEGFAVSIRSNGKSLRLNLASVDNIEEKVRHSYGDNAIVLSVKKHKISPPLIRKKSVRIAASVGYAILASKSETSAASNEQLSPNSSDLYKQYASIVSKRGFGPDARIDLLEGHDSLKELLYSSGLLEGSDDVLSLIPEISGSIKKRRAAHCKGIVKAAERLFSFDIFRFFLTEPKRARASYPLFQGISADYGPQYSFLSSLSKTLGTDPEKILKEKMDLEAVTNMPSRRLGVALLHLAGKPIDWCSSAFGMEASEIEAAVHDVKPYLEGKQGKRSKEFLDLVKKGKKE